jgi:hypothetical protein
MKARLLLDPFIYSFNFLFSLVFWYLLSFYFQIHLCNFEITQVNLEGNVCQVPKQMTTKLMTSNQQGPSP